MRTFHVFFLRKGNTFLYLLQGLLVACDLHGGQPWHMLEQPLRPTGRRVRLAHKGGAGIRLHVIEQSPGLLPLQLRALHCGPRILLEGRDISKT